MKQISARVRRAKERVRRLEEEAGARDPGACASAPGSPVARPATRSRSPISTVSSSATSSTCPASPSNPASASWSPGRTAPGRARLLLVLAGDLLHPDRGDVRAAGPHRLAAPGRPRSTDPRRTLLSLRRRTARPPRTTGRALLDFGLFRPSDLTTAVGDACRPGNCADRHWPVCCSLRLTCCCWTSRRTTLSPALVEDFEEALHHYRSAPGHGLPRPHWSPAASPAAWSG